MEFLDKNGVKHLLTKIKSATEEISRGGGTSGYYNGVDLTIRHKNEIQTSYKGNAWAWINNRVQKQNYEGIFVGDYIPVTLTETQYQCGTNVHHIRVMGINTYTQREGFGHIDFCSKEAFGNDSIQWNDRLTNNGTQQDSCPYMTSKLKTYLTGTVYDALPQQIKAVIVDKYNDLESRYSASGNLQDSISCLNKNMGKVWAPTEYEVFGSAIYGTKSKSEGLAIQYPLFRTLAGRVMWYYEDNGVNKQPVDWWTASVCGGSSEDCIYQYNGGVEWAGANEGRVAPLCFRIAQA